MKLEKFIKFWPIIFILAIELLFAVAITIDLINNKSIYSDEERIGYVVIMFIGIIGFMILDKQDNILKQLEKRKGE